MANFTGQTILITGASGGLGSAVTKAFLDAGAEVVGVARSWKTEPPAARLRLIEADLLSDDGARRAVSEAGRIDALVHLLGGFAGGTPVAGTSDGVWRAMLDLNLTAAFQVCRAVLPGMIAQGRGRIIAAGSRTGVEPAAGLSAYGVSKAGLNALIRTLALEIRHSGITANVVLPSIIDTPANRAAMPSANTAQWVRPEVIAATILWLASEDAGAINGAVVPVYGQV